MAEMSSVPRPQVRHSGREMERKRGVPRSVFAQNLRLALIQGLRQAGILAQVQVQPVPTTKLYRVLLTATKFKNLKPAERQDLVWRIVNARFSPEEQLQISMIVTLTPEELAGE